MARINFLGLILLPIMMAIPIAISYFVIKAAVKNAIIELKDKNII
ncbi:hypothetical protein [Sedimentibacter sp.]|nr:hypothetical protein [Sedimentibacter sp.]